MDMQTQRGRATERTRRSGFDIHTLSCVKQIARGNLLCKRNSWALGAQLSALQWPRGVGCGWGIAGRLKSQGICVYIQLIHLVVQQKWTQPCKAIILLLQSLSRVLLSGTPWTAARQASLSFSTPSFPVLQHLPELAQTHVHGVSDAIQPSHPLPSPFLLP